MELSDARPGLAIFVITSAARLHEKRDEAEEERR
jgi:hypothetical protein